MIRRVPEALAISIAVVVTFLGLIITGIPATATLSIISFVILPDVMITHFIDRIVSSDIFETRDRSVTEFYICFMSSDVFLIRIIYQSIYSLKISLVSIAL